MSGQFQPQLQSYQPPITEDSREWSLDTQALSTIEKLIEKELGFVNERRQYFQLYKAAPMELGLRKVRPLEEIATLHLYQHATQSTQDGVHVQHVIHVYISDAYLEGDPIHGANILSAIRLAVHKYITDSPPRYIQGYKASWSAIEHHFDRDGANAQRHRRVRDLLKLPIPSPWHKIPMGADHHVMRARLDEA